MNSPGGAASRQRGWHHEEYVGDETLPDDEERQLLGALIAISSGVEDVAKLNVPVEVGRRLLQCYDDLRKP